MVRENIETVVRMENAALERRSAADRIADAIFVTVVPDLQ